MISRHIPHKPGNDSYRRLARYIADASHRGEKALMSWCVGCWSGDDEYELGIEEAEIVQSLNTRSEKEKTYHLVVSFRPEDEAKLTPTMFKEIELEFAATLGFNEHQRHAGVHKNTNNLHLHVAFNMIHPERRTRHEPYRDFEKRDRLCRALEQKYGLTIDNGRDKTKPKTITNDAAKAYEAHTGQESLFSYTQRHKPDIMNALSEAKSWTDCHNIFFQYGLHIKPHGNGLVLQEINGKHSIKASDLDRALSKAKLTTRFGSFEAPTKEQLQTIKPTATYTAAPLQINSDLDNLYAQFQAAAKQRRDELEAIKQQDSRIFSAVNDKWEQTRQRIKKMPLTRQARQTVMKKFNEKRTAELKALRNQIKHKRDEVRTKYPFKSWTGYLQHLATQGHETALAILRSKSKEVTTDKPVPRTSPYTQSKANTPTVVAQVTELLRLESPGMTAKPPNYTIDGKGTVIIKLPDGGTIRDTGQQISFSHSSALAGKLAGKLAERKWGQNITRNSNALVNTERTQLRVSQENAISR